MFCLRLRIPQLGERRVVWYRRYSTVLYTRRGIGIARRGLRNSETSCDDSRFLCLVCLTSKPKLRGVCTQIPRHCAACSIFIFVQIKCFVNYCLKFKLHTTYDVVCVKNRKIIVMPLIITYCVHFYNIQL